jgi:hypothetical protein
LREKRTPPFRRLPGFVQAKMHGRANLPAEILAVPDKREEAASLSMGENAKRNGRLFVLTVGRTIHRPIPSHSPMASFLGDLFLQNGDTRLILASVLLKRFKCARLLHFNYSNLKT